MSNNESHITKPYLLDKITPLPITTDPVLDQREKLIFHSRFDLEKQLYNSIINGDIDGVDSFFYMSDNNPLVGGTLSKNPLRNLKYLTVGACSISIRCAIIGGVYELEAYNISDKFIQTIDAMTDTEKIQDELYKLVIHLTTLVNKSKENMSTIPAIKDAQTYIIEHIHYKITLEEVAKNSGYSRTYFSKMFKKYLGIGFSDYIRREKINESKRLIKDTNLSFLEISNLLSFSSQSQFIETFKKLEGTTPAKYRKSSKMQLYI